MSQLISMSDQLHSDRKSYLNFTEEEDDEDEDVYKDFQTVSYFKY